MWIDKYKYCKKKYYSLFKQWIILPKDINEYMIFTANDLEYINMTNWKK